MVVQVSIGHPSDDGRVRGKIGRSMVRAGFESHVIAPGGVPGVAEDGVILHPHAVGASRWRRFRSKRALACMCAALDPDVIHVHEPVMLGSVIANRGRARVVWDVHESYEVVLAGREWIPKPLRPLVWKAWDRNERRLLPKVDLVLAATPGVAERYRPLHGNVVVMPNVTEIDVYDGPHPWTRPLAIFTGLVSRDRGLLEVIAALGRLRAEGLRVPFRIAGMTDSPQFERELHETIRSHGVADDVTFLGMLPRADALALALEATIGVVAHLPASQGDIAWPVKMFEFMANGLPLVYTTLRAMVELAGTEEIGVAVAPGDIAALAAAFRRLVEDPVFAEACGARGRALVRDRYHWSIVEPQLIDAYGKLLAAGDR